jgi:glyoxylase-like metal-dependent hydrolase (beta-lactamase superfamily II)
MQFGDYRAFTLVDADFALDGGSMFGVVPRTLWQSLAPPDDRNRIALVARLLYLEGGGRRILVDTGLGDKWDTKRRDIFAIESRHGGAVAQLEQLGVTPQQITDVILTHLHFDHAAGTTRRDAADDLQLVFPEALHHVQARHWDWAFHPTLKDAGSFRAEDFSLLADSDRLRLVDGGCEIYPGIEVIPLDGHTTAMQAVRVGPPGAAAIFAADLVPTAAHVRWPYIMGFDNAPLITLAEKQRLLLPAAEEGTVVIFQHDPRIGAARLRTTDRGVEIDEVVDL